VRFPLDGRPLADYTSVVRKEKGRTSTNGEVTLVCVVCKDKFTRPANLAVKAKVCTSKSQTHKTTWKKLPDGSTKRISCGCCLCVYKRTLSKQSSLDGKLVPSEKTGALLRKARELYGDETWLAFRLALNAMLRVRELASLLVSDLKSDVKPVPQLEVVALKKKVEMRYKVDIDPKTAREVKAMVGRRTTGTLFETAKRTFQERFKAVARAVGLGHLSIHSLRHTGISNRGAAVTDMRDLNYLRDQARHNSIEVTKRYLGYETSQRAAMAKKVRWY
jgi:integrase